MQLNSFAFFGFFAVIFILYWLAAPHWRVPLLFCASMGFYALFGLGTTALLLVCMLLCWAGGIALIVVFGVLSGSLATVAGDWIGRVF